MQKLYVRLAPRHRERLIKVALAERRDPADQAAILIERALLKSVAPRVASHGSDQ
jgi:hypothetical protein